MYGVALKRVVLTAVNHVLCGNTDYLDVLEENNYTDAESRKRAYARALMYLNGALKDFDYDKNRHSINTLARKLMHRLNEGVITFYFNLRDQLTYYTYASPMKSMRDSAPRILLYNWVPFDNPWHTGGGVTVYCKKMIAEILRSNPDIDIYFLSSGFAYDAEISKIFVRNIQNIFGEGVHQYEIVNSPVTADQR